MGKNFDGCIQVLEGSDVVGSELESELLKSLGDVLPQSSNASFVLALKDTSDNLIGGLTASCSYGWLLVKILWVKDEYRGSGLGRSLMKEAELKGVELGCHHIWLDTSNPEAMSFYQSLNYEIFGQLSNAPDQYPPSHNRWFMKKSLSESN
jgi:GNAT superfamily N-acetyltransferase